MELQEVKRTNSLFPKDSTRQSQLWKVLPCNFGPLRDGSVNCAGANRGGTWLIILALAVAIILSLVLLVAFLKQGSSGNFTISSAGKTFEIRPSGAAGVEFLLTSDGSVTGSFRSNGSVIAYVLSAQDFYNFPKFLVSGNNMGVFYSTPPATSGSFSSILSSGTYFVVFYNPSSTAGAEVQVTGDIVARGSGNLCQRNC